MTATTMPTKSLLGALRGEISKVPPAAGSLPILSCVRLEAHDTHAFTATATDLAWTVSRTIELDEPAELDAAVPLVPLLRFLGSVPAGGETTITADGDLVEVRSAGSSMKMRTPSLTEWPRLPTWPALNADWAELSADEVEILGHACAAASEDAMRGLIVGVHLADGLVQSTDGYGGMVAPIAAAVGIEPATIPAAPLAAALALGEGIKLAFDGREVYVGNALGGSMIRTIEGTFPDVAKLVSAPEGRPVSFHVARADLTAALKVCATVPDLVRVDRVDASTLRLSVTVPDQPTVETTCPAEVSDDFVHPFVMQPAFIARIARSTVDDDGVCRFFSETSNGIVRAWNDTTSAGAMPVRRSDV